MGEGGLVGGGGVGGGKHKCTDMHRHAPVLIPHQLPVSNLLCRFCQTTTHGSMQGNQAAGKTRCSQQCQLQHAQHAQHAQGHT